MSREEQSSIKDDFNSIKVRLKRAVGDFAQMQSPFQFHKGTIKTGNAYQTGLTTQISIP